MAGAYASLAQVVKHSHKIDWKPVFATVSFVGTESFIKAAGKDAEGTIITQVLPTYNAHLPTAENVQKVFAEISSGQNA